MILEESGAGTAPDLQGSEPPEVLSEQRAHQIAEDASAVVREIATVVEGKEEVARIAVLVLLAGGHLLIEDIPGVGKTMLAKSLSAALGADRHRIQFTPDLLPGDVTGASVFNQASGEFEFRPGAVFTQILLADEINRASPRRSATASSPRPRWAIPSPPPRRGCSRRRPGPWQQGTGRWSTRSAAAPAPSGSPPRCGRCAASTPRP